MLNNNGSGREIVRTWLPSLINLVSSRYSLFFVIIFILVLLLPLQGFSGSITKFEKTFWGYKKLHATYSAIRQNLFNDIYYDKVILSGKNWLIWASPVSLDDFQNVQPFSENELAEIQCNLDRVKEQLDTQGVTFLVVITPNKNTIYPEYIPSQLPVLASQSRLDQLLAYQKQYGKTQMLDLRPVLLEEKKNHQVFYATDTHWNPYGALAAAREIILALQSEYPELKLDDQVWVEKEDEKQHRGDMANLFIPSASAEEKFDIFS